MLDHSANSAGLGWATMLEKRSNQKHPLPWFWNSKIGPVTTSQTFKHASKFITIDCILSFYLLAFFLNQHASYWVLTFITSVIGYKTTIGFIKGMTFNANNFKWTKSSLENASSVHLLVFISSGQFASSDRRGTILENRKLGVETVVTSSSEGKRFEWMACSFQIMLATWNMYQGPQLKSIHLATIGSFPSSSLSFSHVSMANLRLDPKML